MKQSYPNASSGLKLMFWGQILSIVGALLAGIGAGIAAAAMLAGGSGGLGAVAILGLIVAIAAYVMGIIGLSRAGTDDEGYRTPLYATIAALVVSVLSYFLGEVFLIGTLLSIVSTILGFIIVNGVCQTTGNLLHSVGNEALVDRGTTVSKIYFICTVISVVCTVISIIPILNVLVGLVSAVSAIVLLVAYIMYLTFLSSGSKALA